MKTSILVFLAVGLIPTVANAKIKEMKLAITSNYAPFHYVRDDGSTGGIDYEIFKVINKELGFKTSMQVVPRKRMESMVKSGTYDCFPNAKEWTDNKDWFVYTVPVIDIQDVAWTLKETPFQYEKPESLLNMDVIGILGYHYPIDEYAKEGKVNLINTENEVSAFKMLAKKRAPIALITKQVGEWLIHQGEVKGDFVYDETPVTDTHFRFVCNKRHETYVKNFNEKFAEMSKTGKIETIIKKYK